MGTHTGQAQPHTHRFCSLEEKKTALVGSPSQGCDQDTLPSPASSPAHLSSSSFLLLVWPSFMLSNHLGCRGIFCGISHSSPKSGCAFINNTLKWWYSQTERQTTHSLQVSGTVSLCPLPLGYQDEPLFPVTH